MCVAGWTNLWAEGIADWRCGLAGIAMRSLTIQYIIVALVSVLLLSSEVHPRLCSMAVTLLRRLKLLQTNRAALPWTISIVLMDGMVYRSHIVETYSMMGRTRVLYPSSLMPLGHFLMLRCRNAQEPLAFLTATSICLFQVGFGEMVTPSYFPALVTPSWTPWRWYSESTGLCLLVILRTSHFDGLKSQSAKQRCRLPLDCYTTSISAPMHLITLHVFEISFCFMVHFQNYTRCKAPVDYWPFSYL